MDDEIVDEYDIEFIEELSQHIESIKRILEQKDREIAGLIRKNKFLTRTLEGVKDELSNSLIINVIKTINSALDDD